MRTDNYDPTLATFTSHDPVEVVSNPYAYVGWDPINRIDPNGTEPISTALAIFAVLAVLMAVAQAVYAAALTGSAGTFFGSLALSLSGVGTVMGIVRQPATIGFSIPIVGGIAAGIYGVSTAETTADAVFAGVGLGIAVASAAVAVYATSKSSASVSKVKQPSRSIGETIVELVYTKTPVAGAFHAFVLVTGPDGEQFFARAGTLAREEGLGKPTIMGGEGLLKTINTDYGEYVPGTVDYTTNPVARQTVLRTSDPGAYGKLTGILQNFADSVEAAGIQYKPMQNSNSFAYTAVGLLPGATIPRPAVNAPGYKTVLRPGQ